VREEEPDEAAPSLPAPASQPESDGAAFPLTDLQQAYWIGRAGDFALGGYSTSTYVEFRVSDIDPARMGAAMRRLVQRHDMLRAVVRPDGMQTVLDAPPEVPLPCRDLRGRSPADSGAALAAWREEMEAQVFDPARWPLFDLRVSMIDGGAIVHVAVDLLIVDYWSARQLLEEFLQSYAEPERGLPAPAMRFRDYVAYLRERKAGAQYARARAYWLGRAADLPGGPALPVLRRPAGTGFTRRTLALSAERWERFGAQARALQCTRSAALLTMYARVLARWAEQARFCLNLTLFDRPPIHPDIMRVVGDFTSLVLVEMDLGAGSLADQVRRTQRRLFSN
jgi:hypothetical protein